MAAAFGRNEIDALIGYSERLNVTFSENPLFDKNSVHIVPAPMGNGSSTYFFTDALALSSGCNTVRCKDAARRFAEFYVSDEILSSAMMSGEVRGAAPRYLLPATQGAFDQSEVLADPIYSQLRPLMDKEVIPYPNSGVPEARAAGIIEGVVDALVHTPRAD